jgi:ribosomal protein S18 acetylase RimI-like enzyme
MVAEVLNLENCDSMKQLLNSLPEKPYGWALAAEQHNALVDYLVHGVQEAIDVGGFVKAYSLGGNMVGLCATKPDDWATRELGTRTFRMTHLLAAGKPEMQTMVKAMLVRESIRDITGQACFVAQVPHTDLASINALERTGFVATQTSVIMAKNLLKSASCDGTEGNYEVHPAQPNELDSVLRETASEIPSGILGWDYRLSGSARSRVHRDWLAGYTQDHGLLMAHDHGRAVGFLAGQVNSEATKYLGFGVGSIDFVATVPEYRNNGVAARLVADSLESFKTQGVRVAELTAYSANAQFVRSCQTHGFTTVESTVTLVGWRN